MRFPDRYQNPADRGAWSETGTDAVDFHGSLQIPRPSIPVFMKEDLVPIIGDENMIQEMPEEFNKVLEVQRSWQK